MNRDRSKPHFLVSHPLLVLAALGLITLALIPGFAYLQIDPSLEGMIIDDDPDKKYYYDEFIPTFGSDEFFVFTYRDPALFSPQGLQRCERIVDRIGEIDDVERVLSLFSMPTIHGTEDTLRTGPPVREIPRSPLAAGLLKYKVLTDPALKDLIVSPLGDVAVIFIFIEKTGLQQAMEDPEMRSRMTVTLEQIAVSELDPLGLEHHMAGVPYVKTEMVRSILRGMIQLGSLSALVLVAMLWYTFRSWRGVWVPASCVLLSLVWTFGLMGYTDVLLQWIMNRSPGMPPPAYLMGIKTIKLDTINTILIPLLMVVGVAHTIHLLTQYHEEYFLSPGQDRGAKLAAIVRTVGHLARPCLLTSVTTAVGFASLTTARIPPIRSFGMFAAVGVLLSYAISIALTPAVLALSRPPVGKFQHKFDRGPLARLLARLVEFDIKRPGWIVIGSIVIVIACVVGVKRLRVETYVTEFFRDSSPVSQGYRFLRRHVTSPVPLEIVLINQQGDFLDPEALNKAETYGRRIMELDEVLRVDSFLDSLKSYQRAVVGGGWENYRLPETRYQVAEALLLMENDPELIDRMIDFDRRQLHFAVRIEDLPSRKINMLLDELRAVAAQELEPDIGLRIAGNTVLFANLVDTLVHGQIYSISLALLVISVIMILIARSVKLGLVAMIPNIFPILFGLGLMGFAGFPLDTNTVMISSIAIGIAVDDSIHLLTRYLRERGPGGDPADAMRRSIGSTGRALVSTSLILSVGFLITSTSPFKPQGIMGLVGAIAIMVALAADLVLTPVCIIWISRRSDRKTRDA